MLIEGVATKEDIDKTMRLGTGVPMGPLSMADFIGLDTVHSCLTTLYEETGKEKYKPSQNIVDMVTLGDLGKKTGRGFYVYKK